MNAVPWNDANTGATSRDRTFMDAAATRIIASGHPDHRAFKVTEPDDTFLYPFPGADNPMLEYLIRKAKEYENEEGQLRHTMAGGPRPIQRSAPDPGPEVPQSNLRTADAHLLATHLRVWPTREANSWIRHPLVLSAALGLPFGSFHTQRIEIQPSASLFRTSQGRPMQVSNTVDHSARLTWTLGAVRSQ